MLAGQRGNPRPLSPCVQNPHSCLEQNRRGLSLRTQQDVRSGALDRAQGVLGGSLHLPQRNGRGVRAHQAFCLGYFGQTLAQALFGLQKNRLGLLLRLEQYILGLLPGLRSTFSASS